MQARRPHPARIIDQRHQAAQFIGALCQRMGAEREVAVTQGKIADILQAQGQLNEALHIRREEQLPVYERLGNVRERAICQVNIAKILQVKNPHQLAEVLTLLQEARKTLKQLGLPEANWVEQELRGLLGVA